MPRKRDNVLGAAMEAAVRAAPWSVCLILSASAGFNHPVLAQYNVSQLQNTAVSVAEVQASYDQGTIAPLNVEPTLQAVESQTLTAQDALHDIQAQNRLVANPSGATLDQQSLSDLICRTNTFQTLRCTILAACDTSCRGDSASCCQLRANLVDLIILRRQQQLISDGMIGHAGIHATMMLAREQEQALATLAEYRIKQKVARENGLPLNDPQSLDRLELTLADAMVQISSANSMIRDRLKILVDNQLICNYIPVQDMQATRLTEDLCYWVAYAQQNRPEVRAIDVVLQALCRDDFSAWDCAVGLLTDELNVPVALLLKHKSKGLFSFLDREERARQQAAQRSLLVQAKHVLQDQIASEVVQRWYETQEASQRFALAQQGVARAESRIEQLKLFGQEVAARPEDLQQATADLQQKRIEQIERLREYYVARAEFELATATRSN